MSFEALPADEGGGGMPHVLETLPVGAHLLAMPRGACGCDPKAKPGMNYSVGGRSEPGEPPVRVGGGRTLPHGC